MNRPVVIGCGNPLREDDGIGRRAAELVEQAGIAEVVQCHQLTPELAGHIEGAPLVIFLDAAVDLEADGLRSRDVGPANLSAWSHHLTPEQLLTLVSPVPPAVLITGAATQMGYRDALTEAGEQMAQQMAEEAIRRINSSSASASESERTTAGMTARQAVPTV